MEKARRLATEGKKVLLTCFNTSLSGEFSRRTVAGIVGISFHDFTQKELSAAGYELKIPDGDDEKRKYYDEDLPNMAFEYF